jgi:predicted Zn-dependent protease
MEAAMHARLLAVVSLAVLGASGCAWVDAYLPSSVRGVIREETERAGQRRLVEEAVDRLGVVVFETRVRTVRLARKPVQEALVRRVTGRLAAAAEGTEWAAVARKFAWEARLVDDNRVDAVAFPGGKVLVNAGVLHFTTTGRQPDEDEVAAVVAHEMTHALARHAAERLGRDLESALLDPRTYQNLAGVMASNERKAAVMAAFGVQYADEEILPFTREQELQADREGMLLMARAGYDPNAAVAFWTRMQAKQPRGRKVPEALALHPGYEKRVAQLAEWLPDALALLPQAARPMVARGRKP